MKGPQSAIHNLQSSSGRRFALYEARWILLILLIVWRVTWAFSPWISIVPTGLVLFVLYFFRDPSRKIPSDPENVVSPADGVVTSIEQVENADIAGGRGQRISIFLSIFDVHINRAPLAGQIERSDYRPGSFFDARKPEAGDRNACRTWTIRSKWGNVIVRQITGAIARRIVAWSCVGEVVAKGDKIGMIRFGSRTDLILPLEAKILVKVGQRVRAGVSDVARFELEQRELSPNEEPETQVRMTQP